MAKTINKEVANKIAYLTKLWEISLKNVDGRSTELDALFTNQANRLRDQIEALRAQ